MFQLDPTYIQQSGSPAVKFAEYARYAQKEYHELIDSDPIEHDVQVFLEHNPSYVPGAWTPGAKSGHSPIHGVLISQPKLQGFNARIPDFMWLSTHSGSWYAAMVEIEQPSKRLFTQAGNPTANFTQARNQLAQWRVWFDNPVNVQSVIQDYGISSSVFDRRMRDLHLILVYGRRQEVQSTPRLSKQRGALLTGRNEELISFDRLQPDPDLEDVVTVTAKGDGRFDVKWIPETFSTSPWIAEELLSLDGMEDAILKNHRITPERAGFLKSRLNYWRKWAQEDGHSVVEGSAFRE